MQPRYRQTPPGFNSGSIRKTCRPKSAARNAAAYPPGPPPITASCVSFVSSLMPSQISDFGFKISDSRWIQDSKSADERQQERLFQSLSHPAQESSRVGSIDQTVIVRQRDRQHHSGLKSAINQNRFQVGAGNP